MTPEALTGYAALLVSIIAVVILPIIWRRQTAKQEKANRELLADQAQEDRERIAAEAAASLGAVTMDTINKAIVLERDRATIGREQDAISHRKEMIEMQERFTAANDKAYERIRRLDEEIADLRRGMLPHVGGHAKDDG